MIFTVNGNLKVVSSCTPMTGWLLMSFVASRNVLVVVPRSTVIVTGAPGFRSRIIATTGVWHVGCVPSTAVMRSPLRSTL